MLDEIKTLSHRYFVVYVSIILTFIILVLTQFGFFKTLDGFLYDTLVKFTLKENKNNIILIEVDRKHKYEDIHYTLDILDKIEKFNPKKIIYTFKPNELKKAELMSKIDNTIFGEIHLAKSILGIYRYQNSYFNSNKSLELQASKEILNYDVNINQKYLVNFNGKNKFAKLSSHRVLQNGVIKELIEDKIVIIGFKKAEIGLYTPLSEESISELEFFAYSLDTLLKNKPIMEFNLLYEAILLVVLVFIGILFHGIIVSLSEWMILFIVGFYILVGFLILNFFNIFIPLLEILIAVIGVSYLILKREAMLKHEEANKILIETTTNLKDKVLPESFYNSDKYWDDVINMINQTLNLTRVIFLEKVENDHRIKEIKALNCSIDSIIEMRRDYEREPFSTAIEKRSYIKIDPTKREFLIALEDVKEEQYLAPLMFSGQILGFWAFGIEEINKKKIDRFDLIIANFTEQISELLYKRLQILNKKDDNFLEILKFENDDLTYKELESSLKLIERRLLTLDNLINSLSTNTILYDIFGKVIQINNSMVKFLKELNLAPYNLNALELIVKLSNMSEFEIKTLLHDVVIEQNDFLLHTELENRDFYLNISPVTQNDENINFEDVYPFEVYGILVELIDVSKMRGTMEFKERVIKSISLQIERQLENFSKNSSSKNQKIINQILLNFNKLKDLTTQDIFNNIQHYYPVDFMGELNIATRYLEEKLKDKNLSLEFAITVGMHLIYATPYKLSEVFISIIELLEEDSTEDEQIYIDILSNSDNYIEFHFKNVGFGVSNSELQKYLFEGEEVESKIYKNIIITIKQIKKWQGEVKVYSEIGEGIEFIFKLKRFK